MLKGKTPCRRPTVETALDTRGVGPIVRPRRRPDHHPTVQDRVGVAIGRTDRLTIGVVDSENARHGRGSQSVRH